jgi:hypothetical protein
MSKIKIKYIWHTLFNILIKIKKLMKRLINHKMINHNKNNIIKRNQLLLTVHIKISNKITHVKTINQIKSSILNQL